MGVITEDICNVLDYFITEHTITDNGEVIDTFYNIKNKRGVVVSQNFFDLKEPFDILIGIEGLFADTPGCHQSD